MENHHIQSRIKKLSFISPQIIILTRSFYPMGLSLLIYKVDKTDFCASESYCKHPSVHTHIVALQRASQEMYSQQYLNNDVALVPHLLGCIAPL